MKRKTARKPKSHNVKRRGKPAAKAAGKRTMAQPKKSDVVDRLVAANAEALGLTIDPAWRGGIAFNLQLILKLAGLVDEFPLPDDTEPGPVFHA
jgi:hypothetical protein